MASIGARSLFLLENSALASSTLLVKCSSTTCKVSVIAFFADDLGRTPYRCNSTQATRLAADKQAWSLLPARASVLHARSLLASNQDSTIYIPVFVRSSEWEGRACTLVAGTQDVPLEDIHIYIRTYIHTYLLAFLFHGAESFLKS